MSRKKYDWPTLIKQQIESGESVVKFCRDNNLNSKSFYSNRTKLSAKKAASGFVKVQNNPMTSRCLTLAFGGATLNVPNNIDAKWLATLLRELA